MFTGDGDDKRLQVLRKQLVALGKRGINRALVPHDGNPPPKLDELLDVVEAHQPELWYSGSDADRLSALRQTMRDAIDNLSEEYIKGTHISCRTAALILYDLYHDDPALSIIVENWPPPDDLKAPGRYEILLDVVLGIAQLHQVKGRQQRHITTAVRKQLAEALLSLVHSSQNDRESDSSAAALNYSSSRRRAKHSTFRLSSIKPHLARRYLVVLIALIFFIASDGSGRSQETFGGIKLKYRGGTALPQSMGNNKIDTFRWQLGSGQQAQTRLSPEGKLKTNSVLNGVLHILVAPPGTCDGAYFDWKIEVDGHNVQSGRLVSNTQSLDNVYVPASPNLTELTFTTTFWAPPDCGQYGMLSWSMPRFVQVVE